MVTLKNILFVDDEPLFLEGIRRTLRNQRKHWEMVFVNSGFEALREVSRIDYDTIVTDIKMPGMDGFALLAALREAERTREVPVIVLTGNSEHDLKRRALDMGATDLLNKPVHPDDLIARLRNALRTKEYQDQIKTYSSSLELKVAERTAELEASRRDIVWRLAKAGEFRDEDTGNHVARVGCYCRALSERLGQSRDFIETIYLASPLHDIGKIGISDSILLKPDKLTPDERGIIERHCVIGVEILSQDPQGMSQYFAWRGLDRDQLRIVNQNPMIDMAISIALHHHERWDGTGYPNKLAGEAIPIEARIVALVDVYDALSSQRPYKPALSEAKVLRIMDEGIGNQFDPTVYAAFQDCLDEFRAIRKELSDERQYVIMV
jgi:putative two-component system response regulator